MHALGDRDFVIGWYEKTPRGGAAAAHGPVVARRPAAMGRDAGAHRAQHRRARGRRPDLRGLGAGRRRAARRRVGGVVACHRRSGRAGPPCRRRGTHDLEPQRRGGAGTSTAGAPRAWIVFDAKAGTRSDEIFVADVDSGLQPRHAADRRRRHLVQVSRRQPGGRSAWPSPGSTPWARTKTCTWRLGRPRSCCSRTRSRTPKATRVTSTPGHSIGAYLTWNGATRRPGVVRRHRGPARDLRADLRRIGSAAGAAAARHRDAGRVADSGDRAVAFGLRAGLDGVCGSGHRQPCGRSGADCGEGGSVGLQAQAPGSRAQADYRRKAGATTRFHHIT